MQKVGLTLLLAGIALVHRLVYYTGTPPSPGALPLDAELVVKITDFVIAACLVLLLAGWLAWVWTGRETWIIRHGLLEIRSECLGRKWARSIAAHELALEPECFIWSARRRPSWRLIARGAGAQRVLATDAFLSIAQLMALGAYLSARTGWRWRTPTDDVLLSSLFGLRGL